MSCKKNTPLKLRADDATTPNIVGPTDTTCNIQQCWELLANNVAPVCTGLFKDNETNNLNGTFQGLKSQLVGGEQGFELWTSENFYPAGD